MDQPSPGDKKIYSDSASDDVFRKEVADSFLRANKRIDKIESVMDANAESVNQRLDTVETALCDNTKTTNQTQQNTAELVEIFQAAKGGFKVMGWLGQAAKWAGGIAIAVGALWKLMGWKSPFN